MCDFEAQFRRRDGTVIWKRDSARAVRDADGRVLYYEGRLEDMTERKRAEEALRESEEHFKSLIASASDVITMTDLDGNILFINEAGKTLHGVDDVNELVGRNAFGFIAQESLESAREGMEIVLREGVAKNREYLLVRDDGTTVPVEMTVSLIRDADGNPSRFIAITRDITERKRAEEQILRLATKLKAIARPARQMSALLDLDELTKQVVRSLQEVTGCYNANFFLLEEVGLVFVAGRGGYEDDKPPVGYRLPLGQGIIGHVAQTGQPLLVPDVSQDPHYVAWEALPYTRSELAVPVKRGDEVLGVVDMQATEPNAFDAVDLESLGVLADQLAVALDNTRLYEETRHLAAFNESIVQSMAEGIIVEDTKGVVTFVNPTAAAIMGYSPEELLGQHWTAIVPPDQHPIVHAADERRMRGEADRYELELVCKDGTRVPVLVSGSPRFEAGRFAGTLVVFTDITERKRTEQLLRALNQAAIAMERVLTPEEIFTAVAEELKKLGFSCVVLLMDEGQSKLFLKYFSYEAGAIKAAEKLVGLKAEDLPIPVETVDVYRKVVWERKAILVKNVKEVVRQLLPGPAKRLAGQIANMLKVPKSIAAPLIVEDKVIGVLSVESDDLTEEDIPAVTAFAHQMAAAWRKARLMQDLERSLIEQKRAQEELRQSYVKLQRALEGTVNALVRAIEMRDPYTGGHQQRVTQLACAIAKEMGLPEERVEGLRMAGLIHDIGKISVPAEILSKPAQLTELEYAMVKAHSQAGYDILNGTIDFPWPVAQIVFQHHERIDGSGYPRGLPGKEIILEARILGVADVVEAMASHRPYRSARGIDKALEEISQNRGVLYDPEVVDTCLKLFAEKKFTFDTV